MNKLNLSKPPRATSDDWKYTLTKAIVSAVPGIGGPAAECFSLFNAPLAKRQARWFEAVYQNLTLLAEKVEEVTPENLLQNEVFITTLIRASRIAVSNHQKEKLEALKNAVLNSALANAPDDDEQLMFLDWVDRWGASHLKMLKFIEDPKDWCKKNSIELGNNCDYKSTSKDEDYYQPGHLEFLELIFPKSTKRLVFYKHVLKDLMDESLITQVVGGSMAQIDLQGSWFSIQEGGSLFLNFITSPLKD